MLYCHQSHYPALIPYECQAKEHIALIIKSLLHDPAGEQTYVLPIRRWLLYQLSLLDIVPDKALFSTYKYQYFCYFSMSTYAVVLIRSTPQHIFSWRNKKNTLFLELCLWSCIFLCNTLVSPRDKYRVIHRMVLCIQQLSE